MWSTKIKSLSENRSRPTTRMRWFEMVDIRIEDQPRGSRRGAARPARRSSSKRKKTMTKPRPAANCCTHQVMTPRGRHRSRRSAAYPRLRRLGLDCMSSPTERLAQMPMTMARATNRRCSNMTFFPWPSPLSIRPRIAVPGKSPGQCARARSSCACRFRSCPIQPGTVPSARHGFRGFSS